jgi:FkbM family methyltransferase
MTPFLFHNLTFNADEETAGAFTCFDPAYPEATDTGPNGMVAEMETFLRLTRGKRALVDVGALFGVYSLAFTAQNPGATAHAIEASDQAALVLLRQCDANRELDIRPMWAFVGDTQGRQVSCTRDWRHVIANNEAAGRETTTVTEVTIDSLGIPFCDVMKIDVEAYECQVLRGARMLIERDRPLLFVECHMGNLRDNSESGASLLALLHDLRYRVQYVDGTPVVELGDESMTRVICYPL